MNPQDGVDIRQTQGPTTSMDDTTAISIGDSDDDKYVKPSQIKRRQWRTAAFLLAIFGIAATFQYVTSSSGTPKAVVSYEGMPHRRLQFPQFNPDDDYSDPTAPTHSPTLEDPFMESKLAELSRLESIVASLDAKVRQVKKSLPKGKFMETDPDAIKATSALQEATLELLWQRYGKGPYRVEFILEFQASIPDYETGGKHGEFIVELGPEDLIPHSVYTILEIARHWTTGAFHRNAPHVLQVQVDSHEVKHLAFQEYSDKFPHKKGTMGYAGRPSGPAIYASIQDNTRNHGPGSQQNANPYEADRWVMRTHMHIYTHTHILYDSWQPDNLLLPHPS
jgi:hypothetical protein